MITIDATIEDDIVTRLAATGHGGPLPKGSNIVCSAASTLLRTMAQILEAHQDVDLDGDAPRSGELQFMITSYRPDVKGWLQGISDYFLFGIKTLEREYPHEIKVNINTKT